MPSSSPQDNRSLSPEIVIGGTIVGRGYPCFIIAEAGVNHNGEIEKALRLIDVAAEAGAGAVKFQTFKAERLATKDAPKAEYQQATTDEAETQLDMLRRLELSSESHHMLVEHSRRRGILFLSTPFDESSADLLEDLGVPAFKISSGDITNLPFLAHVARKGRPMIVSTGMSMLDEVAAAVQTIEGAGNRDIVLLHCVSNYPARPADANLRAMQTMAEAFRVPVGYSDHTMGIEVSLAAVALGACIIEKHFTLGRRLPGPDQRISMEPDELATLVEGVRRVEASLGDGRKVPVSSETGVAKVARKSLVAAADIPAGVKLSPELVVSRRPGTGLSPAMLPQVLGRTLRKDLKAGSMIELAMLE